MADKTGEAVVPVVRLCVFSSSFACCPGQTISVDIRQVSDHIQDEINHQLAKSGIKICLIWRYK